MAPRFSDADPRCPTAGQTRDLPVPEQGTSTHARVFDHAGLGRALAMTRPPMLPSVYMTTSAPRLFQAFAAQWLAYVLPYRRFACTLTSADARLGADADRYSFIAVDLHHLLPAGFDRRTMYHVFS